MSEFRFFHRWPLFRDEMPEGMRGSRLIQILEERDIALEDFLATLSTGTAVSGISLITSPAKMAAISVDASNAYVHTSPDCVNWTLRLTIAGNPGGKATVKWTGTMWIAAAGNGKVYTSPDSITWTSRSVGAGTEVWTACGGYNNLLMVGSQLGKFYVSTDAGATWTDRSSTYPPGVNSDVRSIYWDGTRILVTAINSGGYLNGTNDGISWVNYVNNGSGAYGIGGNSQDGREICSMIVGTGQAWFVDNPGAPQTLRSLNLVEWTSVDASATTCPFVTTNTAQTFGIHGLGTSVRFTSDGLTWKAPAVAAGLATLAIAGGILNANTFCVGDLNAATLRVTTNQGASWATATTIGGAFGSGGFRWITSN